MAAIVMDNIRRLSFSYPSTEKIPGFDDADMSSETSSRHSFKIGSAAADIDIDHINKSLDHVNNFSKRRMTDKLPPVLMYEIGSTGESFHRSMTLRELLTYVNDEANEIDDAAYLKEIIEINMREEAEMLKQDAKRDLPFQNDKPPAARRPSPQRVSESKSQPPGYIAEQIQPPLVRKSTNLSHLAAAKPIYESRYGVPLRPIDEDRDQFEETYESIGALRLRDLRRLDFQFNPNEERSVLIRRHSVLFAMVSSTCRLHLLNIFIDDCFVHTIGPYSRRSDGKVSHTNRPGWRRLTAIHPRPLHERVGHSKGAKQGGSRCCSRGC